MVVSSYCPGCRRETNYYLPVNKPANTIVTCDICGYELDTASWYENRSLEETELAEYLRLKRKYGGKEVWNYQ